MSISPRAGRVRKQLTKYSMSSECDFTELSNFTDSYTGQSVLLMLELMSFMEDPD